MDNGVLLIGGVVALWVLSKAHTGQNLQFQPLAANWDGGALQVQIGVLNPTNDSLQLNSIAGQLYVNGTAVGTVSNFVPTTIQPNQQTPITLRYVPSIFGAVTAILNQITNGGGLLVAFNGSANVNSIVLPVNLNFQAIAA